MQIKAVIFDLDDTLYTDWGCCHQAGLDAVGNYGEEILNIKEQILLDAFRQGRSKSFQHLGDIGSSHNRALWAQFALEQLGVNPIIHAGELHNAYWDAVLHTMVLEPEVPALLHTLKEFGIQTAVCTNMMAGIQLRKLVTLGIAESIDCFVSSEEAGIDKPSPKIFQYVLQKLQLMPEETVMVGDSYAHDMLGALSVGIPCIWLNRANVPSGNVSPTYTTHSMHKTADLLYAITGKE